MFDLHFSIFVTIAVINLMLGLMVSAHGFINVLAFKAAPLISAFMLGLLAFKVI